MNNLGHGIRSRGPSISSYLLVGAATLGMGVLPVRAVPDLVRHLRIRRT
ncbi:MAG TPA: hypothetical protein VHO06_08495 [Polyangia bacterium]|nr:hypothetical protein [Polyangia bacterium]